MVSADGRDAGGETVVPPRVEAAEEMEGGRHFRSSMRTKRASDGEEEEEMGGVIMEGPPSCCGGSDSDSDSSHLQTKSEFADGMVSHTLSNRKF